MVEARRGKFVEGYIRAAAAALPTEQFVSIPGFAGPIEDYRGRTLKNKVGLSQKGVRNHFGSGAAAFK